MVMFEARGSRLCKSGLLGYLSPLDSANLGRQVLIALEPSSPHDSNILSEKGRLADLKSDDQRPVHGPDNHVK